MLHDRTRRTAPDVAQDEVAPTRERASQDVELFPLAVEVAASLHHLARRAPAGRPDLQAMHVVLFLLHHGLAHLLGTHLTHGLVAVRRTLELARARKTPERDTYFGPILTR